MKNKFRLLMMITFLFISLAPNQTSGAEFSEWASFSITDDETIIYFTEDGEDHILRIEIKITSLDSFTTFTMDLFTSGGENFVFVDEKVGTQTFDVKANTIVFDIFNTISGEYRIMDFGPTYSGTAELLRDTWGSTQFLILTIVLPVLVSLFFVVVEKFSERRSL